MLRTIMVICVVCATTLVGVNCRKAQESLASGSKNTKKQALAKKAAARKTSTKKISTVMGDVMFSLKQAQEIYQKAYHNGKIRSWTDFHKAKAALGRAQKAFASISKTLKKQDPEAAKHLGESLSKMHSAMKSKSHPQVLGQMTYALMHQTGQLPSELRTTLLSDYKATLSDVQRKMIAEKVVGPYRVGIWVEPATSLYRWREVNLSDRRYMIKPSRGARWLVYAMIRDTRSGVPLSGTDVSVELLDGKKKKQLSTQKMFFVWRGYPVYAGYVPSPKSALTTLQISISPFPVTRTERTRYALLRSAVAQFPANYKSGALQFSASLKPKASPVTGDDVLFAAAMVGGQIRTGGPYRVGVALVPHQRVYKWRGKPVATSSKGYKNSDIVVFVQDKRTGMMVPNMRVKVFLYHTFKGSRYRSNYKLKPVFEGFPAYRLPARLKQNREYVARIQLRPALHSRLQGRLPAGYSIEFPGLRSSLKSGLPPSR